MKAILFLLLAYVSAEKTHLDDIDKIENFKWDHVAFKTKKDCALDSYPDMKQFLEVESAHYRDLGVYVASEGQSRIELFLEGKKIDTIHIYRWDIQTVRDLMSELGLKRDESYTYEKKKAE